MESNERLVLRLPSDLKAMFTALCESENISVSAKLKNMMANEIQQKLNRSTFHQRHMEMFPAKPRKSRITPSDDVQASTLPETNNIAIDAQKTQNSPIMQFNNENNGIQNPHTGEVDPNKLLLSAINSAKLRQNKKKKKR
jgi:hypothetical protein